MKEVFAFVKGYEDIFMVSNKGQIFSKRTNKILKQHKNKKGYMMLASRLNGRKGKAICLRIHRLVAEAFILNPDNKPFVNHKDGKKDNNYWDNLEWCTSKENIAHAVRTGLMEFERGEQHRFAKLTEENVLWIREHYICYDKEFGGAALGKRFGVAKGTILNIVLRKKWKSI